MKIGLRSGVRLLTAAAFLAAIQGAVLAQDAGGLAQTLQEGIDLLNRGQLDAANKKFREVLASAPESDEAYQLVRTTTAKQLGAMLNGTTDSRQIAERILHLSRREATARSKDEGAIRTLVGRLVSTRDPVAQSDAADEIAAKHGEFAVPELIRHLGSNDIDTRTGAIIALRRIGSDAVLPLAAALGTGGGVAEQNIAKLLGNAGDARGVPALLRAAKAGNAAASGALASMGVKGGDPAEAYLRNAALYFQGDPAVIRNFDAAAVVWSMKDGKPTGTEVAHVIYGYELAEQSAYDALAVHPGDTTAEAMIALCAFAEKAAIAGVSEEAKGTELIQAAIKNLEGAEALANATGPDGLLRAFSLAAQLKHGGAAMAIAGALPGVWGGQPIGADSPLVKSLGHEDRTIRYAAAIALLRINPTSTFPQANAVAAIAGQAAGESAVRQVLVVDSDSKNAMNTQRALNEAGFHAVAFTSGTEGLRAAKMTGGFDAIVVRSKLADITTFQVLDEIGRDVRTMGMKKLVMVEGAQAGEAEADYQKRNVAGYAPTSVDGQGIVNAVRKALESPEGDAGRQMANAMSKAASAALQWAHGSVFSLKDAEAGLLDAAAEGKDEDVRVAALAALGNCATANAQTALRGIVAKSDNSAAVRGGAAGALGRSLRGAAPAPETFDALVNAMGDADASVRAAAGAALGQMKLSPEQHRTLLEKRRT